MWYPAHVCSDIGPTGRHRREIGGGGGAISGTSTLGLLRDQRSLRSLSTRPRWFPYIDSELRIREGMVLNNRSLFLEEWTKHRTGFKPQNPGGGGGVVGILIGCDDADIVTSLHISYRANYGYGRPQILEGVLTSYVCFGISKVRLWRL